MMRVPRTVLNGVGLVAVAMLVVSGSIASAQSIDDVLSGSSEFGASEPEAPAVPKGNALDLAPPGGGAVGLPSFPTVRPSLGGLFGSSEPTAQFAVTPDQVGVGDVVTFLVTVDLPKGSHTYPIDDSATATTLVVAMPPSFEAIDEQFQPDRAPALKPSAGGKMVGQYDGSVTWSKRFRAVAATAGPVSIEGMLHYQVCDTLCKPYREQFNVSVEVVDDRPNLAWGYTHPVDRGGENDPVAFAVELSPPSPAENEEVVVAISLRPEAGWHVGALGESGAATRIAIATEQGLEPLDDTFIPDESPSPGVGALSDAQQHEGPVVWQRRYRVTDASAVSVSGTVSYTACETDEICLPRNEVAFLLGADSGPAVLAAAPLATSIVDRSAFAATAVDTAGQHSLAVQLGLAFLGGLILNVMPCVLPVLAIKLMSFVQQAGESRSRVFLLNFVYSLGVTTVFLALATTAVTLGLGFGEQFQNQTFTIVMATLVLVAALSLLGVFEIPIPGFLGSAGSDHKEGLTGAFLTGVMATVLATPCTGPFIGPLVAWASTQPVAVVYAVWGMMGIGMASPYLLAGVFPKVIDFLPRPGMWMVYFKQVSGFILLGTVVFLMTGIDSDVRLHFLMAMVGVALGCWILGTFRPHAQFSERWAVGLVALVAAGGISFGAYRLAQPSSHELPWQPFSTATLERLIAERQPVLVDFTADWCLICKNNEITALNTEETNAFVRDNDVITLMADYTDESPEIKTWLEKFEQSGVPLTVVYPRGGGEPAVLRGPYTESTILDVLEDAVGRAVASSATSTITR